MDSDWSVLSEDNENGGPKNPFLGRQGTECDRAQNRSWLWAASDQWAKKKQRKRGAMQNSSMTNYTSAVKDANQAREHKV